MSHTPETHPSGNWVPADEVHPAANIMGRAFRCADGRCGVYDGYTKEWAVTHWYFAPQAQRGEA